MKAVIMAGGKGTRLHELTNDEIPKPMAMMAGKPILEWQVECLNRNSVTEICIVIGHLGERIKEHFGDGSNFCVSISYFSEDKPMGTAGALAHIKDFITEPHFLLVFGDVIFDIDVQRMESFHLEKNALATLFVHPNSHPFDSDLVVLDANGCVTGFDSKANTRDYWYDNIVNAGFYILSREICDTIAPVGKTDLEKDVLFAAYRQNRVYGYISSEYIKDVGTVGRIRDTESDIIGGVVAAKNLSLKQRCIFLDRDGTINEDRGLIYKLDDFVLEENAAEAIRLINRSRYLAVVVTNQPVVARGLCGIDGVDEINRKMSTLLGEGGAYLDHVEFCPHHPDKGYPEENPAYKVPCDCRKPGIGMISKAAHYMNVDLSASWMIGDTTRDIQTAKNAGLRCVLVRTGEGGKDGMYDVLPDFEAENLLEAVRIVLENERDGT